MYFDFILFDNKKSEYDVYEDTNSTTNESEILARKVKVLTDEEMDKYTNLLRLLALSKINSKYKPNYTEDVLITKKITVFTGRKKNTIEIIEGDVLIHSDRKDKLPESLINLLKEVEKTTNTQGFIID